MFVLCLRTTEWKWEKMQSRDIERDASFSGSRRYLRYYWIPRYLVLELECVHFGLF